MKQFTTIVISFALIFSVALPAQASTYESIIQQLQTLSDAISNLSKGMVLGVATGDDDNTHEVGSSKHGEHMELFQLVPHVDATHVPVQDGPWSSAATWDTGTVPGDGAQVVIPENVSVIYDSDSDARIKWIRVDGELTFATNIETKLMVDTIVLDADGYLEIGTESNPVTGSADIIFTNDGPIDVSWDRLLQSRGLITHGSISIHGAEKYVHGKVVDDPMKGDTSITMAETPQGWEVGDTIVIAGTFYYGYRWDNDIRATRHYEPEDEVRVITGVSGRTVSFDEPLEFDHGTPRADLKTSVANYSRTVTFRTENGSEATAPSERGHVMFMHNKDIDVRYASFWELGRTDKSVPSLEAVEFSPIQASSNARGRYPLHIHRTGATSLENPVILQGNAVFGTPGWGIVHHDSNAIIDHNATYRTFGAGYVAETGNETGTWTNNIAIYAKGVSGAEPKNAVNLSTFDHGNTGDGYFFQGRMVHTRNNVAASVNSGYAFFHRSPGCSDTRPTCALAFPPSVNEFPESVYSGQADKGTGAENMVGADDAPIRYFTGNETFAANRGIHVTKANPNQGHDVYSHFKDFTGWSVKTGAVFAYTSHYLIEDFDVVATRVGSFHNPGTGIALGTNASDMVVIRPKISGFKNGIELSKGFTSGDPSQKQYVIVDPTFTNITETELASYDPLYDTLISELNTEQELSIELDEPFVLTPSSDWSQRFVYFTGTKRDALGELPIPSGTDTFRRGPDTAIGIAANEGYRTANGKYYVLQELFATDRSTGEIHKYAIPVELHESYVDQLGQQWWGWHYAVDAGPIDFSSRPPVTEGETFAVSFERAKSFDNLLDNDSDPDGDEIRIDGFTQPQNGQAFQIDGETLRYVPDFGFEGTDSIKYWVTDDQGNYTPAHIIITVGGGDALSDIDDDGVEDAADNCPATSNPSQMNFDSDGEGDVCDSDDDNDGIADADEAEGCQFDSDASCGATAPTDSDGDGVADESDNCPAVANAAQTDTDGDGEGDACDATPNGDVEPVSGCTDSGATNYNPNATEDDGSCAYPEPPTSGTAFSSGDAVFITANKLNVRDSAGGRRVGAQSYGATGVISTQTQVNDGTYNWVYVDFTTAPDGWVADEFLAETADPQDDNTDPGDPTLPNGVIEVGDRIETTDSVNVRDPYGLSGKRFGNQKTGSAGTVILGPQQADGYTWWAIDFDSGRDGWVVEAFIREI